MKQKKAIAEKAIAEKAIAEKAIAEKAIAEKAIAEKAIAEKAIAEKAIAEKAIEQQTEAREKNKAREKNEATNKVKSICITPKIITDKKGNFVKYDYSEYLGKSICISPKNIVISDDAKKRSAEYIELQSKNIVKAKESSFGKLYQSIKQIKKVIHDIIIDTHGVCHSGNTRSIIADTLNIELRAFIIPVPKNNEEKDKLIASGNIHSRSQKELTKFFVDIANLYQWSVCESWIGISRREYFRFKGIEKETLEICEEYEIEIGKNEAVTREKIEGEHSKNLKEIVAETTKSGETKEETKQKLINYLTSKGENEKTTNKKIDSKAVLEKLNLFNSYIKTVKSLNRATINSMIQDIISLF